MFKKLMQGWLLMGGLVIFTGINILSRIITISDYTKGFFEGLSAVFMVAGLVYLVWCLVKKKNPNNPE